MKFPYFYFDISCSIYRTLESLFDSRYGNVYVSPPLRILQFCIILAVKLNRKRDRVCSRIEKEVKSRVRCNICFITN